MAATAAILDFRSERVYLFLIYKSPLASYQWLSHLAFQFRRSEKIDFQDGRRRFKSPGCSLPSFKSIGLLVQEEKKRKIDFQDGRHVGFQIETILAIFDLQVTPMLPTKFRFNWPRGVGERGF